MGIRKIFSCSSFIGSLFFVFCQQFLLLLGKVLRLNYMQVSVLMNLYVQGVLLLFSGLLPLAGIWMACADGFTWQKAVGVIVFFGYASIYIAGFICMIRHYRLPSHCAFDICVSDLVRLSARWRMSYVMVNLLIFVVGWLFLMAVNVLLFFHLLP